jgi:magnesium-transporting ATPase (P-type)
MNNGPRSPRERILGGQTALRLLVEGLAIGGAALAAYLIARRGGAGTVAHARTHTFAVLAAAQAARALTSRHRARSVFSRGMFANPWLLVAVALSAGLLLAAVQVPSLGGVFQTVPLARREWLRVAALALAPLPAIGLFKAWLRDSR